MTEMMNFEEALALLKEGKKVKLNNWKNDVYISIDFSDGCVHLGAMTAPYMFVTSRYGRVPWMPTQIEIMSNEWIEYDFEEDQSEAEKNKNSQIERIIKKRRENDYTVEERLKIIINLANQCEEDIEEYNASCAIVRLMRIRQMANDWLILEKGE